MQIIIIKGMVCTVNYRSFLMEMLDQDFHTARDLAGRLNVSEKTVRTRLKALNDILTSRGASIHSKSSMGYQLVVYNQEDFQSLTTSLEKGKRTAADQFKL
ncbi:helix-turn-helix domain-containing protein [Pantoea ananatis]